METQEKYLPAELPTISKEIVDEYLYGSGTKLNEQQKAMFLKMAQLNGLNPFRREIYAIPYGDKFNIVTGYEVYLKRAERTGVLDGWEADIGPEGDYAYCTVYRKDRTHPISQKVWLSEYKLNNRMWNEKPKMMLIKVAIATTFRRAFPDELGGLPYTADEMPTDPIRIPQGKPTVATPQSKSAPRQEQEPHPPMGTDQRLISNAQRKRFYAICKQNGKEDEEILSKIYVATGQQSTKLIPVDQYESLVAWAETKTEQEGADAA
jgi:phage recombination protein Bet